MSKTKIGFLFFLLFDMTLLSSGTSWAQDAAASTTDCYHWIDAATGKEAHTYPLGYNSINLLIDPNHSSIGGHNYVRTPDGIWIDAATGNEANTYPLGYNPNLLIDPNHYSIGGHNFVRVPCTPPAHSSNDTSTGTPEIKVGYSNLGLNPPPTAFQFGSIGFGSALIVADYANLSPSWASSANAFGLSASAMTNPFGDTSGDGNYGPTFDGNVGFHATTEVGTSPTEDLGTALIWNKPTIRFGPALGLQYNSITGVTFNVGGFGEWFATPTLDVFAKLGEIAGPAGNYLGASAAYYPLPDFALNAGVVNTSLGGSNQTDLTAGGEYLFSEITPVSLSAGYTYSTYPGSFHTGQVFAGVRFHLNGEGISTLIDRDRTGEPPPHQNKF